MKHILIVASFSYQPIYWESNLYQSGLGMPSHTLVHLSKTRGTQAVSDSPWRVGDNVLCVQYVSI